MMNVIVSASGGTINNGVYNISSSSPTMMNVTVSASGANNYGVTNNGSGTVRINHSVITGSTASVLSNSSTATTYIGNTQLSGGMASKTAGTLTCAGVYDENYTFYFNTCP